MAFVVSEQAVKYVLKSRIRGRDRWFTIGTHGAPWTPDTRSTRGKAHAGRDSRRAKFGRDQRAAEVGRLLFADAAADRFLREHGKKVERRTVIDYERLLRRHAVPALGDRAIDAIDRAAVAKLHHSLAKTPRQANLLLSVISKVMGWSKGRGLFQSEANPCRGIERYKKTGESVS